MSPTPPPDDAEDLRGSLDDLGSRIDAARTDRPAGGDGRRWVAAIAIVLGLALLGGVLLIATGDDDSELAAGDRAQATTTTVEPTTTAPVPETTATAAPATTTTTAAPETTTTVAPSTTTSAIASPPTTVTSPPSEPEQPPPTAPAPSGPVATPGERAVVTGESFWSIAEEVAGPGAPVGQVTAVWADLLAANADRLVEPGNFDLIVPGQLLVLPGGASP